MKKIIYLFILTIFVFIPIKTKTLFYQYQNVNYYNNNNNWNLEDTFKYLLELNCKFPEISLAQTIGESGWNYSSDIAKNGNNIIGMMNPLNSRQTTCIGTYNNHAQYKSKKDCLKDLVYWQNFTNANKSKCYLKHLYNARYCIDSTYITTYLPSIINSNKFKNIVNKAYLTYAINKHNKIVKNGKYY